MAVATISLASVVAVTVATVARTLPPLPAAPLGYSTWQWAPGTHWGPKQGQYDAVTEKTCRVQADAMLSKVPPPPPPPPRL